MYCVYGKSGWYIHGGPLFGGGPLLGGSVIGGSTVYKNEKINYAERKVLRSLLQLSPVAVSEESKKNIIDFLEGLLLLSSPTTTHTVLHTIAHRKSKGVLLYTSSSSSRLVSYETIFSSHCLASFLLPRPK